MKRALLVVAGVLLGFGLFVALLPLGERLGVLRDLSPPPHFQPLRDAGGRVMADGLGRELWAIDAASAGLVGKPQVDRRWCAREKDAGTIRVLSIGESTTFGVGYAGAASYSRFLEARLRRLLGRDTIEVVNCGKNGNDSHDWPTLAPELAGFAPDLVVAYVGHNELKKPNLLGVVDPAKARLRRSKLLRRLLGEPIDELPTPPSIQAGPFLTLAQRSFALELFDEGLRALLEWGRDHRIPVVVCIPASNLLDSPPRLSLLRPGDDAAVRLAEVGAAGLAFESVPLPDFGAAGAGASAKDALVAELARVERTIATDPDAAILHFRRARMLLALRRTDEATAAFAHSLALDGLPERASPDVIAATYALTREFGVPFADVESRFAQEAARGVAGNDLFIDYCHPNLWGHFLIADEIVRTLMERDLLAPKRAFDAAREPAGSLRERFDVYTLELGISEQQAAAFQIDQAKLQIGNLGTRLDTTPRDWKVPEEFLRAALLQDPGLPQRSATFLVLLAICRAGAGDAAEVRRLLQAAAGLDVAETSALAQRVKLLPGIVKLLETAGVTADDHGFHWKTP